MIKKLFFSLWNLDRILYLKKLKKRINNKTISLSYDIEIHNFRNLQLNDFIHIGEGVKIHCEGSVKIGRGSILGPRVKIYSANHRFRNANAIPYDSLYEIKPVVIGENVWIGAEVIIVPGASIGEGVIIGAGTVVTGTVPSYSIIGGNPGKIIGKRDEREYLENKKNDNIYLKLKIENSEF